MQKRYRIEPRNPFFEVASAIVRHEVDTRHKVTFVSEVDLTKVDAIRNAAAASGREKPSFTALVVKAVALGLREKPYANRRVVQSVLVSCFPPFRFLFARYRIQAFDHVDVAVAVERQIQGSEMAAFIDVLRDVDEMPLSEVRERLYILSTADEANNKQWRTFSGLVRALPSWLAAFFVRLPIYSPALWVKYRGGAAMVSAPGKYGFDTIVANWWAPLGVSFGVVRDRPIVIDGELAVRRTFNLTMNFDLRIMAGAQAAQFFRRVVERLRDGDLDEVV